MAIWTLVPRIATASIAGAVLTACAGPSPLDARMKPMVGVSEAALIERMGRAPDASLQSESDVRVLSWRRAESFAVPKSLLFYQYAGSAIKPIAHSATGIVDEACIVEWVVERGLAKAYRVSGARCAGSP